MTTGTEALSRLLARREARTAAFTKGEHGLFTGSEPGSHAAHRDGDAHSDSRIHRAINEGIQALKGSSIASRQQEFTHNGESRTMVMSNARDTTRPDTPNSEIAPTLHQAADNPDGMELDRPIVVNGTAVDVKVLPEKGNTTGHEPGMSRDKGGSTAMMGAADQTTTSVAQPKPVVVQAPPPAPAPPDPSKVAKDLAENAERDQRLSDLERDVKEMRTELDGMQEIAVDSALSDMDAWTQEGGDAAMPVSMIAAVGARYALPPAMVEAATPSLPPSMVAAVEEKHALPARQWVLPESG